MIYQPACLLQFYYMVEAINFCLFFFLSFIAEYISKIEKEKEKTKQKVFLFSAMFVSQFETSSEIWEIKKEASVSWLLLLSGCQIVRKVSSIISLWSGALFISLGQQVLSIYVFCQRTIGWKTRLFLRLKNIQKTKKKGYWALKHWRC